jgi:hypothetical protein
VFHPSKERGEGGRRSSELKIGNEGAKCGLEKDGGGYKLKMG